MGIIESNRNGPIRLFAANSVKAVMGHRAGRPCQCGGSFGSCWELRTVGSGSQSSQVYPTPTAPCHLVLPCASRAANVKVWKYPKQICEHTEVKVVVQMLSTGKEHTPVSCPSLSVWLSFEATNAFKAINETNENRVVSVTQTNAAMWSNTYHTVCTCK